MAKPSSSKYRDEGYCTHGGEFVAIARKLLRVAGPASMHHAGCASSSPFAAPHRSRPKFIFCSAGLGNRKERVRLPHVRRSETSCA